jgi:hypothetical protein
MPADSRPDATTVRYHALTMLVPQTDDDRSPDDWNWTLLAEVDHPVIVTEHRAATPEEMERVAEAIAPTFEDPATTTEEDQTA